MIQESLHCIHSMDACTGSAELNKHLHDQDMFVPGSIGDGRRQQEGIPEVSRGHLEAGCEMGQGVGTDIVLHDRS